MVRLSVLLALTAQNASLALLMRYSRSSEPPPEGRYNATVAVVICEVFKLIISLALLTREEVVGELEKAASESEEASARAKSLAGSRGPFGVNPCGMCSALGKHAFGKPYELLRLSVPGLLYTFQNNIAFFAITHLEAATYQLLYQLKILATAIFSILLLRKQISARQWGSLCMLVAGVGL